MLPHERENLLFIDVETDERTFQVLSIQWRYRGEHGIITEFTGETYAALKSLWDRASAVVMWNALFDMGALSVAYPDNVYSATRRAGDDGALSIGVVRDAITLKPRAVNWGYRGKFGTIDNGFKVVDTLNDSSRLFLKSMWDTAARVRMHNPDIDIPALQSLFSGKPFGALTKVESTAGKHSYGQNWKITVFGHYYHMRKTGGHFNFITPYNRVDGAVDDDGKGIKSTPVIDLLKLWAILIDSKNLSLSAVAERHLQRDLIPYSAEAACTDEYRYQDVDVLDELVDVFLEKVSAIEDLDGYTCEMWSRVASPATFVKFAYERAYPTLRKNPADRRTRSMREKNEQNDRRYNLTRALEDAYFGGITMSFYRGTLDNAIWYDIKGAYSRAIQVLNTDQYLAYDWRAVPENQWEEAAYDRDQPALCQVTTDAIMASINKSLKIYRVQKPCLKWYWNFDVQALRLLFPDCMMTVERVYKPIPLNPVKTSLPAEWDRLKDEEQARNGKTTRREFFKLLSNTSYGIKAQRDPRPTAHTNLCIAGMITARSHLALIEMADECRKHGLIWRYSDTDSVCVTGEYFDGLTDAINERISPFTAECEGYDERVMIFSLKRYIRRPDGDNPDIKVHGRGQYKVDKEDILAYARDGKRDWFDSNGEKALLEINQLSASTPLTMRTLENHLRVSGQLALLARDGVTPTLFPFAFTTDVETDKGVDEFMADWYNHIDTKTTIEGGEGIIDSKGDYERGFHVFPSDAYARLYYGVIMVTSGDGDPDPAEMDITDKNVYDLFHARGIV